MTYYEPGEMLTKLVSGREKVSADPSPIDAILYIEYIIHQLKLTEGQKVSINEGQYYLAAIDRPPYRFVFVEDAAGKTQFYAGKEDKGDWDISTCSSDDDWLRILEYAYDKIRTSLDDMDRFITEFPPIGIL